MIDPDKKKPTKITTTALKNPRKAHDKYYTERLTDSVVFFGLRHHLKSLMREQFSPRPDKVLFVEPCAGDGAMVKSLERILEAMKPRPDYEWPVKILSYDLVPGFEGCKQCNLWDMSYDRVVADAGDEWNRIVFFTNPPYQIETVPPSFTKKGDPAPINVISALEALAMKLLWASRNEVTGAGMSLSMLLRLTQLELTERAQFMNLCLDGLIPMKRLSFTGDGKTDMATTAWFLWSIPTIESIMDLADADTPAQALQWAKTELERSEYMVQNIYKPFIHTDRSAKFDLVAEIELLRSQP